MFACLFYRKRLLCQRLSDLNVLLAAFNPVLDFEREAVYKAFLASRAKLVGERVPQSAVRALQLDTDAAQRHTRAGQLANIKQRVGLGLVRQLATVAIGVVQANEARAAVVFDAKRHKVKLVKRQIAV